MTLPTGNLLKAARALAGLRSAELAALAKIDPATLSRLEAAGHGKVRGQAQTVDAVIAVLKARGIQIDADESSVKLVKKPRR
jgi:transcriptional regulator with XRE-family HTH domain